MLASQRIVNRRIADGDEQLQRDRAGRLGRVLSV